MGMYLIAAGWIAWFANPTNWPTILAVAAGLGFVIFVHELGHFLVAKACGVKCEKFYLGFDIYGLKLFKFRWGETEYGIGILPLGGYVKMLGQDDNPARMAEENRRAKAEPVAAGTIATAEHAPVITHGDLPPEPVSDPHEPYDPRSYMAQSVPKRMAIISAGVIMNVIFAFIMASIAFALGVPEAPCIVGGTMVGGAAWRANLELGDKVTQIGNVKNPRFRDLQTGVTLGDVENGIPFTILRVDGQVEQIVLHPDLILGKLPMIGVTGAAKPQLADRPGSPATVPHSPAAEADPKFKPGDTIVQINQMPTESYRELDQALAQLADQPVDVTVERVAPEINQPPEKLVIKVEPAALSDFGIIMPLGSITAVQKNSPAEKAGLQVGDRITTMDGQPVGNPLTLEHRLGQMAAAGKPATFEIERPEGNTAAKGKSDQETGDKTGQGSAESTKIKVTMTPRKPEFSDVMASMSPLPLSSIGVTCRVPTTVVAVEPGSPAADADIRPGDELISAKLVAPPKPDDATENEPAVSTEAVPFGKILSWPGLVLDLLPGLAPGTKVQFEAKREDKTHLVELSLTELKDEKGGVIHTPHRGFVFAPLKVTYKAESLLEAIRMGGQETVDSLLLVYRFLQKIGQSKISVKLLGGPVEIAKQAGMTAQQGAAPFLLFLTMLSANLAVINFLPIPVLDGGHMVFLLYEGIRGKPASERVVIAFTYAGLAFILSLMVFVLSLDLGLISRH